MQVIQLISIKLVYNAVLLTVLAVTPQDRHVLAVQQDISFLSQLVLNAAKVVQLV